MASHNQILPSPYVEYHQNVQYKECVGVNFFEYWQHCTERIDRVLFAHKKDDEMNQLLVLILSDMVLVTCKISPTIYMYV